MPTGILTATPAHYNSAVLLIPRLPELIAPRFNIEGAELHEGGVTEREVIIRLQKGSEYDRNAPDLNLFLRAHQFSGRTEQCQDNTVALHDAIRADLDANGGAMLSLSVEIIICELGYASSTGTKED